jgi:hypothetical protein
MLVLEESEKIVTYLESSIFENRNDLRPANMRDRDCKNRTRVGCVFL